MSNNNINIKVTSSSKMARDSLHDLSKSFVTLDKDGKRANTSMQGLVGSLGGLKRIIGGIGIYKLADGIAKASQSAMDIRESVHMYNIAMGEFAEVTSVAVDKLSELSGMDRIKMLDTVGEYNLLARSMGMTAENAVVLSENTNRLALDLSALTNRSVVKVQQDLRSGLIGQSKTMYKYGVDVTEAALKQEALNQGIEKSVRHMSQAEKMALRYSVMIKQTGLSHGDFANTIESPANQLRILSDRMLTASRSLGTIFIPMLSKVLPYLNAFATAINNIFVSLAKIFGYEGSVNEKIENTSSDFGTGMADGLDDVSDSAKGTGKAVDKLRKKVQRLAGFDELNILGSPETPSSPSGGKGGGAGGGAVGGIDFDLKGFDSLIDNISQVSDELVEKVQKVLEFIFDLVKWIGITFLSWKIADAIIKFLHSDSLGGGLIRNLKDIGVKMGLLGISGLSMEAVLAGVIAVIIGRFVDLLMNSELFRGGLVAIWDTSKEVFGWIGNKLKDLIGWFGDLGKSALNMLPESWQKNITKGIDAIRDIAGKLDLDWKDLIITLGGIALLFTPFAPLGIALLGFELLTVAVRAIGYGASDSLDEIDFFANGVSEATIKKLEPFREKMNELNDQLLTMAWGNIVIDDATMVELEGKLREVTKMIVDELDADQNEALGKLRPLAEALGQEAYMELLEANETYYDEMKESVLADEQAILEIIRQAKEDGGTLTQEHYDQIEEIRSRMNDVGIKHIAETEIEYNKIMGTLSDNAQRISLEQASGIMKNSLETKNQTIDDARTQYSTIELEAKRMLEVGALNEEQYKDIMDSAKETRDETIKNAEEQYDSIHKATVDKLGKTGKYLDQETGEIKSKWKVWTESLSFDWETKLENIKKTTDNKMGKINDRVEDFKKSVSKWWSELGDNLKKDWSEMLETVKNNLNTWKTKIETGWQNVIDSLSKKWEKFKDDSVKMFQNIINGISEKKDNLVSAIKEPFKIVDKWISTKISDAFNWGKNLIGSFIDGIKSMARGVTNAVSNVMGGVKDFMGFSSPTKKGVGRDSDKWMPNMMNMFAEGIEDNRFKVAHAMEMTVSDIHTSTQPSSTDIVGSIERALSNNQHTTSQDGGIVIQIGERTILDTMSQGLNRETRINGKSVIRV